jgi:hypothetical protein
MDNKGLALFRRRLGLKSGSSNVLSAAQRKRLPSSSFALPGQGKGPQGKGAGSYPIPDKAHARNALARVAQHGSPAQQAEVRRKVHAKFPGIK